MFFARNRRRPSRRFAFSFESLQTRVTPSDISGAGGAVEDTDAVITPDMYPPLLTWTIPGGDTPVDDSTAQGIDPYMMTVPTFSC